jgi:hypothetical protein
LGFYGPADWSGGNPEDDIEMIQRLQTKWDIAYSSLGWLERMRYYLFGWGED